MPVTYLATDQHKVSMPILIRLLLSAMAALLLPVCSSATELPDCSRPLTLALHEHRLLYSQQTGSGIDKDFSDELIRRSHCKVTVSVLPRARIWQLIESGALDFSLSGIRNDERDKFAGFAWYFSNKYYLLVRRDAKVHNIVDFAESSGLQLGVIRSFRYSHHGNQLVDELKAQNRVTYASGLEPLYQILQANRIQGMIIEPFDYAQVTQVAQVGQVANASLRDLTQIIDIDDPAVPHGLIMSKKSISFKEQEKWRALVEEMRQDGTIEAIFTQYFKPDLAKTMVNF